MSKVSNEALLALIILGVFTVVGTLLISYSYSTGTDSQPSFTAMSVTNIVPLANLQERLAEKNIGNMVTGASVTASAAPTSTPEATSTPTPANALTDTITIKGTTTTYTVPLAVYNLVKADISKGHFSTDLKSFEFSNGDILTGFNSNDYKLTPKVGPVQTWVYGNKYENYIYSDSTHYYLKSYSSGQASSLAMVSSLSKDFSSEVEKSLLSKDIASWDAGTKIATLSDGTLVKVNTDSMTQLTTKSDGSYEGIVIASNGEKYSFTAEKEFDLATADMTTFNRVDFKTRSGNPVYVNGINDFYALVNGKFVPVGIRELEQFSSGNNAPEKIVFGSAKTSVGAVAEQPEKLSDKEWFTKIFGEGSYEPTDSAFSSRLTMYNQRVTDSYGNLLIENEPGVYSVYGPQGNFVRGDIPPYIALSMSANDLEKNKGLDADEFSINGEIYRVEKTSDNAGMVSVFKDKDGTLELVSSRIPLNGAAIDKTFVEVKTDSSGSTELRFNNQKLSVNTAIALGLITGVNTATNTVIGALDSQITDKQLAAAMKEIPADARAIFDKNGNIVGLESKGITYTITKPTDMDKSLTISSNQPLSNLFISSSTVYDEKGKPSGDGAHFVTETPGKTDGGIELSPQAYDSLKEFNGLGLIPDKLTIEGNRINLGNGNYFLTKKDDPLYSSVPTDLRTEGVIADKDGKKFVFVDKLGRIGNREQDTKGDNYWRDSVNGFTTKLCVGADCVDVPYECNKNNPGCITGLIDWESLKKNGVSDSTIAAMKEQVDFETTGLRWQAAYRAALGAAKIGNMVFCSNEDCFAEWRRGVDKLFRSMFGFIMYPEESLCKKYVDRSNDAGFAFIEAPNGLMDVVAHVEGERTGPITHPNETNANQSMTEYLYKFTFYVENPRYTKEGFERKEFSFNIELHGSNTKNLLDKDVELKAGQSHSARGREAMVFYDPVLYTEVCIVFDGEEINWKNPLCNKIAG